MEFTDDEVVVPSQSWWIPLRELALSWFHWRRLPLVAIVMLFIAGNVLLPGMLNTRELTLPMFFVGGLTTQVALLATYAALAPRTNWSTTFGALFLLLVAWGSYLLGLQYMGGVPREAAIFILLLALFSFLWYAGCLVIVRRFMYCRIAHKDHVDEGNAKQPVGIANLLLLTAFAAVSNWYIKQNMPSTAAGWGPYISLFIFGAFVIALECFFLTFVAMVAVMSHQILILGLLTYAILIPAATVFYLLLASWVFQQNLREFVLPTAAFFAGHLGFTTVSFAIARVMGYQLFWVRTSEPKGSST